MVPVGYRVLLVIIACAGILVGCTTLATPAPTATSVGTGIRGAIIIPPGSTQVDLYSDSELMSFAQFGSTPGSAIKLTQGVHVEFIDYEQRVVYVKEGTLYFNHVRVLDGPSLNAAGWMAQQLLPPLSR